MVRHTRLQGAGRFDDGAIKYYRVHKDGSIITLVTKSLTTIKPQARLHETIVVLIPNLHHHIVSNQSYFSEVFNMSPSSNPNEFIPSLKDKVILVTGGNIGLGKETILQLAKHKPAKIYMASRTESKARDAIKSINAQLKEPASIEYLPLDLSSLKSVQAAAQHVNASSQRLDILILNAGIMAVPATKTESGHDIQLGTNHIGHFTLDQAVAATAREDSSPAEIGRADHQPCV